MDSEYSEPDRLEESNNHGVEIRETHPLLTDSEREVSIVTVEVKPTAPPDISSDTPSTSATALRRQSQNSSAEDVTDRIGREEDVVTTEPLPSTTPPGELLNNQSELDSAFAHNHHQLKSKFDTEEPDNVEGYATKICYNFIQCCAIFIEG